MRDFTIALDERLQQLAVAGIPARADRIVQPPAPQPTPARRPRRPMGRRLAATGIGGIAIAAVSTTLLTGSGVAGLPIFATATTDASALARGFAVGRPIDFSHAHVIRSSGGTAAITSADQGARTCLAIPDPSPGVAGAMGSCKDTGAVEQSGFLVQSIPVQYAGKPTPRAALAFILPVGASNTRLVSGGQSQPVSVTSGVALAFARGAARLRYELDGRLVTVAIAGPFPEGRVQCPDGHTVAPKIVHGSDADGHPGLLDPRKLCAGHETRPKAGSSD